MAAMFTPDHMPWDLLGTKILLLVDERRKMHHPMDKYLSIGFQQVLHQTRESEVRGEKGLLLSIIPHVK